MTFLMNYVPDSIDAIIEEFFESGFGGTVHPIVSNTLFVILCLFLSSVFSGLIGFTREKNGYPAGLRTHLLLSLGSCLIMLISTNASPGSVDNRDPLRLAAAGVTGISFLGAGAIMQNGFSIKGLTSAASIWVTMAIGMCCGAGLFLIGTLVTVLALIFLTVFRSIELKASSKAAFFLMVVHMNEHGIEKLLQIADGNKIKISDVDSSLVKEDGENYIRITFRATGKNKGDMQLLLSELKNKLDPVEIKILK